MESDFDASGGDAGSWWDGLTKITGQILEYKTATAPVRWTPYTLGAQYTVGANGELIRQGVPASSPGNTALVSLLPLALIAGLVFLAVRALK